jgi:glycerol uptake facilitator-like aquaporin
MDLLSRAATFSNSRHIPCALFVSEMIGTALLVLVGMSLVILMFGNGTPMAHLIPSEGLRRLITGFLFGTTGVCIALSPVGKVSGAHINPVVTLAFRLMGKLDLPATIGYIASQLIGSIAACVVCSLLAKRIKVAKLYYFDTDQDRIFRRLGPAGGSRGHKTLI